MRSPVRAEHATTSANPTSSERPEGTSRARSRRSPAAAARKRDDDACRARAPTRSALGPSPGHGAAFAAPAQSLLRRTRTAQSRASAPTNATSRSSTTPNSSRARRRASAISATQSALVAPSAFSMKFACLGEITRAADPVPLQAAELEHAPAPSSPGGFLNTLPNVRLFVGCVAFRCAISSATVALISSRGRGSSRSSTRATTSPGPSAECRYESASSVERHPVAPVRGRDERARDDIRPVAPVCAGVHLDAASRGARNGAGELEAAEARIAGAVEADGVRRASACHETVVDATSTAASSPSSRITSASTPVVRGEQVRAQPDDDHLETLGRRVAERLPQLVERPRPGERARRTSRADRRQLRERDAALDRSSRAARLDDRTSDLPRLPHAERDDDVAGTRPRKRRARPRRPASAPSRAGHRRRHAVQHELPGDAGTRRVAPADHVRDDRRVREPERLAELR